MALPNRELELWNKLVSLPLDRLAEEPAPEFGFTRRLMRDEKWDYATAIRVSAEYRRFLLLAHLGPISPSPKVDAAWHLHLTYTRAYNTGLCERTLGRALDHSPSGGIGESAHYASVYADTLDRYREVFGEEPPADIWPASAMHRAESHPGLRKWAKPAVVTAMFLAFFWFAARPGLGVFIIFALIAIASTIHNANAEERKRKGGDSSFEFDAGGGGDGCGGGCGGGGCG